MDRLRGTIPPPGRSSAGAPHRDAGKGWRSRGYLPHFDSHEAIQHVTFHLADSLPAHLLERLERRIARIPPSRQAVERHRCLDAWVDAGHGACLLCDPAAAALVQDALLFHDGDRYRLLAWVVMPNHVHALFQPMGGWTMSRIVASWKSYTGRRLAPRLTTPAGPDSERRVWFREYWDRFIRDERHFLTARAYIHNNPVKAGLVSRPEAWRWSSAGQGWKIAESSAQAGRAEPGGPRKSGGGPTGDAGFRVSPGES